MKSTQTLLLRSALTLGQRPPKHTFPNRNSNACFRFWGGSPTAGSMSHSGYGGPEVPYPIPKDFTFRKTSLYSTHIILYSHMSMDDLVLHMPLAWERLPVSGRSSTRDSSATPGNNLNTVTANTQAPDGTQAAINTTQETINNTQASFDFNIPSNFNFDFSKPNWSSPKDLRRHWHLQETPHHLCEYHELSPATLLSMSKASISLPAFPKPMCMILWEIWQKYYHHSSTLLDLWYCK